MSKVITLPDFAPHQLSFFEDTTRYCALVGGFGSGKTYSLAYKIMRLSAIHAGLDGMALSPTYSMLWEVLAKTLIELLEEQCVKFEVKSSASKLLIYWGRTPSTVHFRSAENYERLAGLNLAWAAVDEIDTMKPQVAREAWRQINARIRVGDADARQTACASTPEGFGFLWDFFEHQPTLDQSRKASRSIIRGCTLDCDWVDDDYIRNLVTTYAPHQLSAYIFGEFVNLASSPVYYAYDVTDNNTTLTIAQVPRDAPLHLGVDFNMNAMSGVVGIVQGENAFVIDEIMGSKNTAELIRAVRERYGQRQIIVYPDASGAANKTAAAASDIAQLYSAGFVVQSNKANPRIKDRVNAVNARFCNGRGERRLLVNSSECRHLSKTLRQQTYGQDGMPVKDGVLDGPNDAIGYFINKLWPINGRASVQPYLGTALSR